jgi:hypothetical protein
LTVADLYPVPNMAEMLIQIGNVQYLSALDMARGYNQILLKEVDRVKSAFTVRQIGQFIFNYMPFGMQNSGSTFQRMVDNILSPCSEIEFAYVDDLVIFSSSWTDHLKHLEVVFKIID